MEWEIQKRSKECHACEREFREGDTYHCLLKSEDTIPIRRDFCEFCWQETAGHHVENEDYISYWQSHVKPKLVQKKEDPIQRSVAERLLRKYLHSSDSSHKNVCYVLALMLERKKILLPRKRPDGEHDGRDLLVYEHAGTGETFLVEDPHLALAEVNKVQKQVQGILEMEQVGLEQ
jgi:hypothetical protein